MSSLPVNYLHCKYTYFNLLIFILKFILAILLYSIYEKFRSYTGISFMKIFILKWSNISLKLTIIKLPNYLVNDPVRS